MIPVLLGQHSTHLEITEFCSTDLIWLPLFPPLCGSDKDETSVNFGTKSVSHRHHKSSLPQKESALPRDDISPQFCPGKVLHRSDRQNFPQGRRARGTSQQVDQAGHLGTGQMENAPPPIFETRSHCQHYQGWGLSAKLGKHSAIWGKLGTALQAYALNPCTKFPPNPTSRKVNT